MMIQEFQKRLLSSIILLPLSIFLIFKGSLFFNIFILSCLCLSLYEWHFMSKKKIHYFPGLLFIIFSFFSVYKLRNDGEFYFFLLVILICISTDIGGYVFGKIFKGPKLISVSPNKTYSGMIGSFILSMLFAILFMNNLDFLNLGFNREITLEAIIFILMISLLSQIGDLIISFFKRKANMKNTGKLIPGHGGILDRIDGMIFVFPIVYTIFKII